jgi:molybdopterin-containing oxidoreductase family iron-sulfur binding subunit
LTWDNGAIISPAYAKHLGVNTSDMLRITVTDAAIGADQKPLERTLEIPALVIPGHADNSVTIPLGYGRKMTGPVGEGAGFNAYQLRTSANPHFIVADGKAVKGVKVEKISGKYAFASVQEHWSIEGRGLVREATVDRYREDPEFVRRSPAMTICRRSCRRSTAIRPSAHSTSGA